MISGFWLVGTVQRSKRYNRETCLLSWSRNCWLYRDITYFNTW